MYRFCIKRLLDIVLSFIGIIVFWPLFVAIAIAIKIDSPGPILFKQRRVGKNKHSFVMLKYRTMKIDAPKDTPSHLLENPDRHVTRCGKFLRRSSLDEIIQVVHVFSGKMSLIGPRPALWNQHDLIERRDIYGANSVRPGLTGWAQVNGRDELPIDIKSSYDGEYVKNMSFIFDCKCFFMTILKVVNGDGVIEGSTKPDLRRNQPNNQ